MRTDFTLTTNFPSPDNRASRKLTLFFDPLDEQAIGDALERITTDNLLRERLAKAGPTRARRFTWEQTALATLRALDFGT